MKKAVISFWEIKLRSDAAALPSLQYFNLECMSLRSTHPILRLAGPSPYQSVMSRVQATMLSGRYRTDALCSKWSTISEFCKTPSCLGLEKSESLAHILADCPALESTRMRLLSFTEGISAGNPIVLPILEKYCTLNHPQFVQFLLNCSALPEVITLTQQYPDELSLFLRITRTWCYVLHKARLKILSRWIQFQQ